MRNILGVALLINAFSATAQQGLLQEGYNTPMIGFDGQGFLNIPLSSPTSSVVVSNINYWNGVSKYYEANMVGNGENYMVRWTGYMNIPVSGYYGFGTISDDGSQVIIDNVLVVDNSELQWFDWEDNISDGNVNVYDKMIYLDEGKHSIDVRFYEDKYFDGIQLWWYSGLPENSIPPYSQGSFHSNPPVSFNSDTNWEIMPASVFTTD